MSYATFEDANRHLDQKKLRFDTAEDASEDATSADVYIRGQLGDLYGDLLEGWGTSNATPSGFVPELIREAASYLMAAFRVSRKYGGEQLGSSSLEGRLRMMAQHILDGLREGTMSLLDVEDEPVGDHIQQNDFWPNDKDIDPVTFESTRKFTMAEEF